MIRNVYRNIKDFSSSAFSLTDWSYKNEKPISPLTKILVNSEIIENIIFDMT